MVKGKLLREAVDFRDMQILKESNEQGDKTYRISGPFLEGEVKNANSRVYPNDILNREVKLFNENKIANKRSVGELNHPENPDINLDRVSHIIESLVMDGNVGHGVARVTTSTPMGRIVKGLIDDGIQLGMSTRGVGSVDGSTNRVNSDFVLITVDIVGDPSAPNAFVDPIIENKEYIINESRDVEMAYDQLEESLSKHGDRDAVSRAMLEFLTSDFLSGLK